MNYPMMKPKRLTVAEFRSMELNAPADERWELINGRIVRSMAGGTKIHNLIVYNAHTALMSELRKRKSPCRAFSENVRLDIPVDDASTLPDVVVSCTPWKEGATTLRDAVAIVEVLSPSTALFDLESKLSAYLKLPSLLTCAFIEQDEMRVVVYAKIENHWVRDELTNDSATLNFGGLGIEVPLETLYEDVALARAEIG